MSLTVERYIGSILPLLIYLYYHYWSIYTGVDGVRASLPQSFHIATVIRNMLKHVSNTTRLTGCIRVNSLRTQYRCKLAFFTYIQYTTLQATRCHYMIECYHQFIMLTTGAWPWLRTTAVLSGWTANLDFFYTLSRTVVKQILQVEIVLAVRNVSNQHIQNLSYQRFQD